MDPKTFAARRRELRENVPGGAILLLGHDEAPRNYPANPYPFRQNSHFLYYVGTDLPGMAALIEPDGEVVLYGPPEDPDDLIWHGPHPVLEDHARAAGIDRTAEIPKLAGRLSELRERDVEIHFTPPYRGESRLKLAELLGSDPLTIGSRASAPLARAITEQRSIKSAAELAEIERALAVSAEMCQAAMRLAAPGRMEYEVVGAMQGIAAAHDMPWSFPPICTIHGEVLHNNDYSHRMEEGQLLLIDSGVEAPPGYYPSDITRTMPVAGSFDSRQKAIYQVVLDSQLAAIEAASPKLSNRELHLLAARVIASGLKDVGLMRGEVDEAVAAGAHALFFVHGLGHMIGGDVHDMEDLGDVVGYPEGEGRSSQFGLAALRLAKKLRPGFCLSVEPGVYFVPALIERWKAEKKHEAFIDYAEVEKYLDFGGVRIEDDIAISENGCRVLGPGIPKEIGEVEGAMSK